MAVAAGTARRGTAIRGSIAGRIGSGILLLAVAAVVIYGAIRIGQRGPLYFLQTLTFGVADGAIYALIALGYTMVYGIIELINFAHGDVFTLGAFISLSIMPAFGLAEGKSVFGFGILLPLLGVFLITMALCAVINVLIERIAYRPLRNAPRLAPLITAVGMSFILEGAMYVWKGPFNLHYPSLLPTTRFHLAGASIGVKDVMVIVAAITLVVVLALFINLSKLGKAMRATAQDRDAAQLMGININWTIAATFFIGACLAGAGGVIYGLYFNFVDAFTGFNAGLIAFTAAVFGGIGNIPGAAIGGLVIGIIYALWSGYFAAAWAPIVVFGILILVLVFRPTGLLGMRVPEK